MRRASPSFTIAPSHDDFGSNAVLVCPPTAVPLTFGDDSFYPHLRAAQACGIKPLIVRQHGIGLDIDRPGGHPGLRATALAHPRPGLSRAARLGGARSRAERCGRMTASPFRDFLRSVRDGHAPTRAQALALSGCDDLAAMMTTAAALRDRGHGANVSYSRKVFIPLTKLCRDSCHYCTFAQPPRRAAAAYLSPDEVLAIARAGARAGCREALFTLGDKPELRYGAARDGAGEARLRHHARLSRRHGGAGRQGDRAPAPPQSRRDEPATSCSACAGSRCRRASCWRPPRSGWRARAARISARPTRCRRCGSPPSRRPARPRCRSPPAS